jgi:4-alpha-glucanotransferase
VSQLAELEAKAREPLVDYAAIVSLKRPLLESMSRKALRARPRFFEELLRTRPDAVAYARFRSAAERRGVPWPAWSSPPPHEDLSDPEFLYHVYAQALAEEQIASVVARAGRNGVRLYFDMPLGVHPFGFDTWSRPSLFAGGAEVGAPPDAVFPDGQSWGFPPIVPDESRSEGHLYFRECLGHVMRHAGLLRIDHVMGLHRQFWIPAGFEKRDGVYVRYPAEELHAVASLESDRHRTELIGENLGIVPESVNRALDRHGWRGIYVLQFRLTGNRDKPLEPAPPNAVASFNTHDTPTFAGFRLCRDLDDRVEAGLLDREKAGEMARARAAAVAALDAHLGLSGDGTAISQECLIRWLQLLLESDADLVGINLEGPLARGGASECARKARPAELAPEAPPRPDIASSRRGRAARGHLSARVIRSAEHHAFRTKTQEPLLSRILSRVAHGSDRRRRSPELVAIARPRLSVSGRIDCERRAREVAREKAAFF